MVALNDIVIVTVPAGHCKHVFPFLYSPKTQGLTLQEGEFVKFFVQNPMGQAVQFPNPFIAE
jgi:hypothetical protein